MYTHRSVNHFEYNVDDLLFSEMGKAKHSPSVRKAQSIKKKYEKGSPGKPLRCRRALLAIEKKQVTIRKASELYGLSYGYLQRRLSGDVEIERRNGPMPIFNKTEEEAMARWLQEMANRGMGLKPAEFLDSVQKIVIKESKVTPFTNNRPGYDWYYAFMTRNRHLIQMRNETPLETCRAKLTKEKTDQWYSAFREFLSSKGLIGKPKCIWNADETGFSMGSVSGKVIGPTRAEHPSQVPHLSGGHSKQRFTVMFCGSADGTIMPPYFVYPEPKPRGYNPLTGAMYGSDIAYTKKGWMDATTFQKFLDHFHLYAGTDRPVVLLIDSVSSHISMSAFELASQRGIELYRIVPNATHLMQPLDVGVFGPLKQRWHQVVRTHTRNSPGTPISKENFAEKLKEAFLLFYKPLTVTTAFRSSGIYPVDGTVITKQHVKPGITFSSVESVTVESKSYTECSPDESTAKSGIQQPSGPFLALKALESVLTTPTKAKYTQRLQDGYDIRGQSPCFDVYKKLLSETTCETATNETGTSENITVVCNLATAVSEKVHSTPSAYCEKSVENEAADGLDLLATTACARSPEYVHIQSLMISPTMKEALTFPSAGPKKLKRKSQLQDLPDNLTSSASLRAMSLKSLSKIRSFREREIKARKKYMAQEQKKTAKSKIRKRMNKRNTSSTQAESSGKRQNKQNRNANSQNLTCMFCKVSWAAEDQVCGIERAWLQCDLCDQWLHSECSSEDPVVNDDDFFCEKCEFKSYTKVIYSNVP